MPSIKFTSTYTTFVTLKRIKNWLYRGRGRVIWSKILFRAIVLFIPPSSPTVQKAKLIWQMHEVKYVSYLYVRVRTSLLTSMYCTVLRMGYVDDKNARVVPQNRRKGSLRWHLRCHKNWYVLAARHLQPNYAVSKQYM